jgi:hypothetical protein
MELSLRRIPDRSLRYSSYRQQQVDEIHLNVAIFVASADFLLLALYAIFDACTVQYNVSMKAVGVVLNDGNSPFIARLTGVRATCNIRVVKMVCES